MIIKCKICNREFRSYKALAMHLMRLHKDYSTKKYYDQFLLKDNENVCRICGKNTKFQSLGMGYSKTCSLSCSMKQPETERKRKNTWLKTLGVLNPLQSSKIQERIKNTCLKKYGVPSHNMLETCKEKSRKTCLSRYGHEYYQKTKKFKELAKTFSPSVGNIGFYEKICLDALEKEICYSIIRQYKTPSGYFLDGYIKELNLAIEYDEPHHKYNGVVDQLRQNCIFQNIGCSFFRIDHRWWKFDQKMVINSFLEVVNENN